MKRLWILLPLLAVVAFAEPASAQGLKAEGFYIGASAGAGLTKLEFENINLLDDSALVWKVGAGWRWRFVAIEFDYRQLSQLNAKTVLRGRCRGRQRNQSRMASSCCPRVVPFRKGDLQLAWTRAAGKTRFGVKSTAGEDRLRPTR